MNRVTYGELIKALNSLGFHRLSQNQHLVFDSREQDALIVLPRVDMRRMVSPAHLLMVEKTVVEKGVATRDEFFLTLQEGHRPLARPIVKM